MEQKAIENKSSKELFEELWWKDKVFRSKNFVLLQFYQVIQTAGESGTWKLKTPEFLYNKKQAYPNCKKGLHNQLSELKCSQK